MDRPLRDEKLFAWNGICLNTPERWELASHRLRGGICDITMEDEARLRLELQWLRPKNLPDTTKARSRFDALTKELTAQASVFVEIPSLPDGWSAFRYAMPQGQTLILAYCTPRAADEPLCFLRLHFEDTDREAPTETLRRILTSFVVQREPLWLWQFYDVSFRLHHSFRLTATSLQAGRKMLQFEKGLRRLFVWHVSMAQYILKNRGLADWCAEYLNGFRAIRGPVFHADGRALRVRRRRWQPFGHYEEIGRWCFRYTLGCKHLETKNQIAFWVYNCRSQADLERFADECSLAGNTLNDTIPSGMP